MMMSKFVDWF